MNKKYYSLNLSESDSSTLDIFIYGDIYSSYRWYESYVDRDFGDVLSARELFKDISSFDNIKFINVFINSNGGEVAEGLAIYNILKRHDAFVTTFCDGFACSAASIVFLAGDKRVMSNASLLMVHNAWNYGVGNANDFRKFADDLDKITEASINAYLDNSSLDREKVIELLDNESWICADDAFEFGFATDISKYDSKFACQSVSGKLVKSLINNNSFNSCNNSKLCIDSINDLVAKLNLLLVDYCDSSVCDNSSLDSNSNVESKNKKCIDFFKSLCD